MTDVNYADVPLLEMKNVRKHYEGVQALKRMNFKVHKGETVGLIGDNGAGKSTLIKIIAGVVPWDGGEVYWNGRKVDIRSVKDARELGIETVFQEQALVDILPISSNIFLGREPTMKIGALNILDHKRMTRESIPLLKGLVIDRARILEKKNGEMVTYAKESMAELDSEGNEIRKHLKLLDVWRRRALARLGEVDATKKNMVSLIVTFEECSVRFGDQLLVPDKRLEKPIPASIEELMASLYEKRTRVEVKEKITEE